MIICSLNSDEIVMGKVTAVSLTLHNQSNRDCISLFARVKFPREVGFLTGKRQFKIDVLEANQQKVIPFKLKGKTLGSYPIGFHNFRYRDGYGDIKSLTDLQFDIKVIAAEPPLQEYKDARSTSSRSVNVSETLIFEEINKYFDMNDIENLCFMMRIDSENIVTKGTKESFIRYLIRYCSNRRNLRELCEAVVKERPFLKNKLLP